METVTVVHSATCVNGKRNYQPGPNWYVYIISLARPDTRTNALSWYVSAVVADVGGEMAE